MSSLNGTHGTCRSYAEVIAEKGSWLATDSGLAGRGVYFWAFNGYAETARRLAISWWDFASSRGSYSTANDKACAVIYVQINVEERSFLDFDSPPVRDALLESVDAATKPGEKITHEIVYKIYERLIEKLESALKTKFDVLKVSLPPPKRFKQKIIVGNPDCYVVRGDHKTITLQRVEAVDSAQELMNL